jgi:hypothetical protein
VEGLGKITKDIFSVVGVLADIRTGHLSNTSTDRYRYTDLLNLLAVKHWVIINLYATELNYPKSVE